MPLASRHGGGAREGDGLLANAAMSTRSIPARCAPIRAATARILCVVEEVGDLWALERAGAWSGLYHVLGGTLSAIEGVRPEDLSIGPLIERAGAGQGQGSGAGPQRHGRGPDHGALHHRAPEGPGHRHLAPGPWRAGGRRTRLPRRRHADAGDPGEAAAVDAVTRRSRGPLRASES